MREPPHDIMSISGKAEMAMTCPDAWCTNRFLRLGKYLEDRDQNNSKRYFQAGLTIAHSLFKEPYLSADPKHQGLILHSVYHQPNHWDHVPKGKSVACGEATMWGDYHARELALYSMLNYRNSTID